MANISNFLVQIETDRQLPRIVGGAYFRKVLIEAARAAVFECGHHEPVYPLEVYGKAGTPGIDDFARLVREMREDHGIELPEKFLDGLSDLLFLLFPGYSETDFLEKCGLFRSEVAA